MGSPLSEGELDDVAQEVALVAWSRLDSFAGASAMESWVWGIARICILSAVKNATRRARPSVTLAGPEGSDPQLDGSLAAHQGPGPGTREVDQRVRRQVQDLGTTLERIVLRHHVDNRSFARIGEELGVPTASVKSRYYRALPKLRARLRWLLR